MILSIRITAWEDSWTKLEKDVEAYAKLREILPQLHAEWQRYPSPMIVDDDGIRALSNMRLTITLEPLAEHSGTMLVKLQDRLEALGCKVDDLAKAVAGGAVVQIAVPDIGLMLIEEVRVNTDCCTEVLQQDLDQGWRILAVCPPNAQRRPDYVLGRRKK